MSIRFPVVPDVPGVPALLSFPGVAPIVGSINGTVLTVNAGIGAVAQGLSLSGSGINPSTVLTSGLTAIDNVTGIGTALVNIPQTISNLGMSVAGSLGDLLPDVGGLLGGDTVDALVGAGPTLRWGIFRNGAVVVLPDSVVSVEYKKDWHISDYPIEQGNFESYNKVRIPYDARVTLTKGGSESERSNFLETIESIAASLDLYDIVTPDATYTNANVVHFDYRRTAESGVSLLAVAIWLQEVRLEASSEFVSTVAPSSSDQVNVGVVQPQDATPQEVQTFDTGTASGAW